jgi:hypothetical protein
VVVLLPLLQPPAASMVAVVLLFLLLTLPLPLPLLLSPHHQM